MLIDRVLGLGVIVNHCGTLSAAGGRPKWRAGVMVALRDGGSQSAERFVYTIMEVVANCFNATAKVVTLPQLLLETAVRVTSLGVDKLLLQRNLVFEFSLAELELL